VFVNGNGSAKVLEWSVDCGLRIGKLGEVRMKRRRGGKQRVACGDGRDWLGLLVIFNVTSWAVLEDNQDRHPS
jgi:hypothetical protein